MAFCRKCGTKLNEGVKFCPKCGHTVDGVLASQPQENQAQQEHVENQEENKNFTYRMWHNKWNWIAAIALLIVVGAAKTCGGS
ncbi:MAG: zinc-ribbon domain-containing protein [Bacteroidaceae bacterium]|nr:zinc-ribbon domain-containing protein [Bacteroidaceae bacterium]